MWKKALIGILGLAAIGEFIFAAAGFVAPVFTLQQFKIQSSPETLFLGYIISWFLLFVAVTAFLALRQVIQDNPNGWILSYILGVWWMGIGFGIFLSFGRPDNLVMDTLKGAIIVICAWKSYGTKTKTI